MKWNNKFIYPKSLRSIEDGLRKYLFGDEKLPGVTSILQATKSEEDKASLELWKERVGHKEAERIKNEASSRGSSMHSYIEQFLLGKFNLDLLDEENSHIQKAKDLLKDSLINKPERYDRTWASKSRYSMDWYYPILCGLLDRETAKKRIENKWDEFIVEGKGCKCVSEEPWVTIAESCELVMALMRIGLEDKAKSLFDCLHQWRDEDDGLYWTGYVYTDKKYWPVEKPTWTAGAVLLAADSLYKFTEGSELFLVDLT